ncbi:MAG: 16S rRNA (cytosine(1402)-N(4))-methyltransferase RsmH [Armatimonadota bacterium]|nr:16S rRNA (cytosine(1402)-N(4))-methyltransferase RsmH [Armatimonadota bacterium]
MPVFHKPVLLNEVIGYLAPKPGGVYADCTLGGGGYAEEILSRGGPDGVLIGIDRDEAAIEQASRVLSKYGQRAKLVRADFRDLRTILDSLGVSKLDGVAYDLGVSGYQLETGERGFSLMLDAPLDMRMDRSQELTAADLVSRLPERELADLIKTHSDERWARRIARRIAETRARGPISTTKQLADLVAGAIPRAAWPPGRHPATRTFQALRIAVNTETEALEKSLREGIEALSIGGRAVVVSYHSGEDRIVKRTFRLMSGHCECPPALPECACGAKKLIKILTKKPVVPSPEEIKDNPRARSARLRAAEKVAGNQNGG